MDFLLDADGLIKLNRAGVLELLLKSFDCLVSEAVYDEAVTQGKQNGYLDAEEIEEALDGLTPLAGPEGIVVQSAGLGKGDSSVLELTSHAPTIVVVSDDRRLLSVLSVENVPFLTPPDMLVVMKERRILTRKDALDALELMRPMIRAAAYWEARQDIEQEREDE